MMKDTERRSRRASLTPFRNNCWMGGASEKPESHWPSFCLTRNSLLFFNWSKVAKVVYYCFFALFSCLFSSRKESSELCCAPSFWVCSCGKYAFTSHCCRKHWDVKLNLCVQQTKNSSSVGHNGSAISTLRCFKLTADNCTQRSSRVWHCFFVLNQQSITFWRKKTRRCHSSSECSRSRMKKYVFVLWLPTDFMLNAVAARPKIITGDQIWCWRSQIFCSYTWVPHI